MVALIEKNLSFLVAPLIYMVELMTRKFEWPLHPVIICQGGALTREGCGQNSKKPSKKLGILFNYVKAVP